MGIERVLGNDLRSFCSVSMNILTVIGVGNLPIYSFFEYIGIFIFQALLNDVKHI